MKKSIQKKDMIVLFVLIVFLLIVVLGGTYAYYNYQLLDESAGGVGGCFNVNYEGQDISSSSLKSTTDYLEGARTVITLSKDENCDIYTKANIYIRTDKDATTAPIESPKALKYKVFKGNFSDSSPSESDFVSEGVIADKESPVLLASDINLSTDATNYTIYIWIDSDESNGEYDEKTYSGYIYAESVQSSTVKE